jgi:RNA recognition motif-containing protein
LEKHKAEKLFSIMSSRSENRESRAGSENRIYVGNLPPDIRTKDVEDLFYRFGKVLFVDLKNRRGK